MERRHSRWLTLLAVLVSTVFTVAQTRHDVGGQGSRLVLPKTWFRERVHAEYGNDQFVTYGGRGLFGGTKPVYVLVDEHLGLLEGEADYRRAFARLDSLANDGPLAVVKDADWLRVTKTDVGHDGEYTYRAELLVVEGYALHLLCYAATADAKVLDAKVEELLDGVELPGDGSSWHAGMQPVRAVAVRGGLEVSFAVRPFVLHTEARADCILAYRTADDGQGLRVWEMRNARTGAQAIDQEVAALKNWNAKYRELRRAERTIDGVEAHEQWAAVDEYAYRLLLVRCGADRWVAVRHWARGKPDEVRPDRDAIFASFQAKQTAAAGALPAVPAARGAFPRQPAAVRTFLQGAQRRRSHPGQVQSWVPERDGTWIVTSWNDAHRLTPDGSSRLLCSVRMPTSITPWDGGWLVASAGSLWQASLDALPVTVPYEAQRAALVGGDLFYVRSQRSAWQSGIGYLDDSRGEVVRRTAMATEDRMATIVGDVLDLEGTADGSRVLLAVWRQGKGVDLLGLDAKTPKVAPLANWEQVNSLAPADTGWLVNGRPRAQPFGIWHLLPDGTASLLVGGGHVEGVRLGEELWISFQDREGDDQSSVLATVSIAHCKATGPALAPVACEQLGAIGGALLQQVPQAPRTVAELDAAFAVVQAVAKERLGRELSIEAEDVDAHMDIAEGRSRLGPGGRIVLVLLLAARARADGADWVEPDGSAWLDWVVAADRVESNAYAVVHHLPSRLVGALDDSEGSTAPAVDLLAQRGGRRLLCGIDARTLQAAAAAVVPAQFTVAADPVAWIDAARAAPTNTHLRTIVLERLANARAWAKLEAFARAAVTAKDAGPDDHVAWLLAREQLVSTAGAVDPAFEADLLAALRAHGREARLWQQLASHFERQSPPANDKARICWENVLEIGSWGAAADAAKAALQRLDTAK